MTVKRYECYEYEDLCWPPHNRHDMREAPDGAYVLYTDAVKMQREAFVQGAQWSIEERDPPCTDGEYDMCEAEAAKRYKEDA